MSGRSFLAQLRCQFRRSEALSFHTIEQWETNCSVRLNGNSSGQLGLPPDVNLNDIPNTDVVDATLGHVWWYLSMGAWNEAGDAHEEHQVETDPEGCSRGQRPALLRLDITPTRKRKIPKTVTQVAGFGLSQAITRDT